MEKFKALWINKEESGLTRALVERSTADLPEGELLIKVLYSSVNYKDALSANGHRGVTRNYPHTPGIDAAGVVVESKVSSFTPGDQVIVTGYDLGMNTPGGFGQYIRVPAAWVLPQPKGLSPEEAMSYGTAGFTAGLSVAALVDGGITPGDGPILVTGATGGVGSVAISILGKLGYQVIAMTGKKSQEDYLKKLGATDICLRNDFLDQPDKPLLKTKYAGIIDTAGGQILATALKLVDYNGIVTSCGNVASNDLPTTVLPFILRGVTLVGIDSVLCPIEKRNRIWKLLGTTWKNPLLLEEVETIGYDELIPTIEALLEGRHKGRTLLKLW